MTILKIFDYLREHAIIRWASLLVITMALLVSIMRLSYKEDIQDFLPLSETNRERMAVYQDISGMNRLFVVFESMGDAEETTEAIDCFVSSVEESDTANWCQDMQATFDLESLSETMDFVYANAPLFLAEDDYRRMDSLLALPNFMDEKLEDDLNALMLPTGSLISENISRDPLGFFTPLMEELQQTQRQMHFEIYDGYIFTPDMTKAIVMLSSPFGSSETKKNAQLITLLDKSIKKMQTDFPKIKARVIGGPQVAVGNAKQIMRDSILAVFLAAILILALLLYAFRRFRDIVLIALSVLWGWLFALGGMALVHDNVSMIVIGISSIIIGIAVNYPLHLTSHAGHQPDIRQALREITTPLLVGNITTVGAFLALVPLKSIALRDLGLFASFLLVGTILFVLVYLPHLLRTADNGQRTTDNRDILSHLASVQVDRKRWLVVLVAVLTLVFGYFSLSVKFDSDVSNINYMTAEQKEDMAYFQKFFDGNGSEDNVALYLLSSATDFDDALACSESKQAVIDSLTEEGLIANHQGVNRFLPSLKEQEIRINRWNEWLDSHPDLISTLDEKAAKHGFSAEAFSDFADIIQSRQTTKSFDDFLPLTSKAFAGNVSRAGKKGNATIVETLSVKKKDVEQVRKVLPEAFDIGSLHSSVADALSGDFNYVGWACSLIVFVFLWLSFRRIELAIISFIPMAISWIWILGIMSLLGIKFNIVNIILATFIFGQGDDYTIFMTEGCISEYIHKKPILAPYKRSIILSALIMFIGIGTLIFAKHPALHSLAEVTIIGMFSVVLMAYLIPPLLFRWMMKRFPQRFEKL
ncbi:MAG: MMPL family transporter [Bacteroidaceae bacterium]|nr:MMPL family transporter [Bacteroidaceae bacterium]